MNRQEYKALIFAPLPPPVGGIASIVAMLHKGLAGRPDVGFVSPIAKTIGWESSLIRPLRNFFRLAFAIKKTEIGGRILLFSSEAASFFEKTAWSILILALRRKPVVFMVSGLFPQFWEKLNSIGHKFLTFLINRKSITLVAQSESWLNYYRSIFPSADIKLASATAAQEFFSHQRTGIFSKQPQHLLFVGWIIPEKGIFDLLDAMVILVQTHPDVRLRLVGPLFDKDDAWKQAVAIRGISNQVEFLGVISDRKKLIQELDAASIFVFPSHFEGFPVALLEAITMGLPCVGTSVGGIPDILDNGVAGILVKPKAPQELAEALHKLIADNNLREEISTRASERAIEVYSHSKFIDSFECLLGLKYI
jgi:glycosyltransferase involved in cell wall biosynthesis